MEDGHEGGTLKVEYKEKVGHFDNQKNSHQSYYLSAYYNCCHHTMEPVTRGFKLTLAYNLVCKSAKMATIPIEFPVFLTTLNEVKRALTPWIPPKEYPGESEEKKSHVQPLFFVLKEKYQERTLSFHRLQGEDRKLAHILQCSSFLEVHLALVKTTITTESHISNKCTDYNHGKIREKQNSKISKWIDSNNTKINLDVEFDWEKQCVGPIGNLLKPNGNRPDKESTVLCKGGCVTPICQKQYHFSILVIWPKHESLKIYCRHGLDSFLDHMEISLNSSRGQQDAREKAVQDLRKIISFCCEQPVKVWTKPDAKKGKLTLKLLRLCTSLGAREEGLALLKILGSDFHPHNGSTETFEGIQNGNVARAIVEFECDVAGKSLFLLFHYNSFILLNHYLLVGWKDCEELIKQMISPIRICKQFVPIVKLAKYLKDFDCDEGAMMVADHLSSSLANINQPSVANLTKLDVGRYINLIVNLEMESKTSNPKRMTTFVAFFHKLEPSLQCRLVLDYEAQNNSRLKDTQFGQLMFREMCKALTDCNLRAPLIKDIMVVDMLVCYVRLGNADWLNLLTSNICRLTTSNTSIGAMKNELLENVISSPVMLQLATGSELEKTVVASLVDAQFNLVNDQLSALQKETNLAVIAEWPQRQQQPLLRSLTTCLRLVLILEKETLAEEPPRFSSMASLITKLNFQQLSHLLADILSSNSERLLGRPCSVAIIRQMCDALLLQFKNTAIARELILETVRCFIRFGDESLTRLLIDGICAGRVRDYMDDKCSLFTELVSSPDIWGKLDATSKLNVLNTCATVVELGMSKICQFVNPNSTPIAVRLSSFVNLFILSEKNRICPEQKTAADSFLPHFDKLPTLSIMDLVLEVHQVESKTRPNIKKFPICFHVYRALCRCFFNRDFVSLVHLNSDYAVSFVHVLLWLADEQCWKSFADKICIAFLSQHSNCILRVFLSNVPIQEALVDSPPAFDAFARIVNYWIQQSVTLKEPILNWQQPNAELPGHPAVEAFLRSPLQSFSYKNFPNIRQARQFANELQRTGPMKGFNVTVKTSGTGSLSCCEIVKNEKLFNNAKRDFEIRKFELTQLVHLLGLLNHKKALVNHQVVETVPLSQSPTIASTSDEVCIVSPPKRPKLDIPFIEID